MGQRHAYNVRTPHTTRGSVITLRESSALPRSIQILRLSPRAELVAIADPAPAAAIWAAENLPGVK